MSLSIGIIGLPNVGKSTLFNALLNRQAALAANYPFATIEPNVGIVDVPDERIAELVKIVKTDFAPKSNEVKPGENAYTNREVPEKIIPATVKFYDIAGLVKGASQGEGLGNAFLGHIREVDAIVHVVRAFDDDNIVRAGSVSPQDDIEIINTELILSDLQLLDKRLARVESESRTKRTEALALELSTLTKIKKELNEGKTGNQIELTDEESEYASTQNFLSFKPVIYVYNISEEDLSKYIIQNADASFKESYEKSSSDLSKIYISAKIESEIAALIDPKERQDFMQTLGIPKSGLDRIIKSGYDILGLQTFFTIGPKEVHAWTITKGMSAPQAAGKIHTDFERGFISAQIVSYNALISSQSEKVAKANGKVRLEGKTYIMQDGDVVEFNFSV